MKYPDIDDPKFYSKIRDKFDDYKIRRNSKTLEDICFPKRYELQLPQQFVAQYVNPKSPYKAVLVYHRIGAGKTCTGVRVGEAWKQFKNIVVVVPASLKGNFRNELRSLCAGEEYLTNSERKQLTELHPTDQAYRDIIKRSDERIDKYYQIYSYNKFVELIQAKKINLRNTVLIIDEIQNMVSEEGTFYIELYKLLDKAPSETRIVLLSATPMFDKPGEIALTMNLLQIPNELPTGREFDKHFIDVKKLRNGKYEYNTKNMDEFKDAIKGYVSYFRGAPPHVFPEMKIKYVRCEMSEFQYSAYKAVLRNEEAENLGIKREASKSPSVGELPNNFFIGTRYVSNIVFPNRRTNDDGYESFTDYQIVNNLAKYSCKFEKIIAKVEKTGGKVFFYSGFKEYGGLRSFARVLSAYGYSDYTTSGEGKRRYAIWSGDEDIKVKEEIKSVFNQKSNLNGSKLKILLLSPSAKEGLSLFGIRQAHILEPYWNRARLDQIIGRGSRFCSHKDLPPEKRNIKVYIYMATHPELPESIDEYINYLSIQKNKIISEFEKALKESSVDCQLNYSANVYEGEDRLVCQK